MRPILLAAAVLFAMTAGAEAAAPGRGLRLAGLVTQAAAPPAPASASATPAPAEAAR